MKKILATLTMSVALTTLMAQTKITDKISVYDLPNSKLHVYQTHDAMGDVSFIVEGEKSVVILEQPLFWDNIKEFNAYVESLDKPIDKVVANYHSLGLADYQSNKVMMPTSMIEFGKSPMAQGMISKFEKGFGEAADFRPHKKAKGFAVPSIQKWGGVQMSFTPGAKSDFPAATILIDSKVYYAHFAPAKVHASPLQVRSRESVDAILAELSNIKSSGAEYIFGSHGAPASQEEVAFQIDYYQTVKRLMEECSSADLFGQRLIVAYPSIPGIENIKVISKALYPDEVVDSEKEVLRGRMDDYLAMVSNIDEDIANGLWATTGDISIITPRSQFFGLESIMNDFLRKTFSSFKSRKLSSLSEVINIYGDSANIQLYWNFDTVDANGVARQGRGRESLIFSKIDGVWRLVHVHYSPAPQQ